MLRVFGDSHNANATIKWQPEPVGRGTWTILSTCLLTMSLCIWTAVHLNVPPPGTSIRGFLRKTGWLLLGLIAPEIVVFTAWRQFSEARATVDTLRDKTTSKTTADGIRLENNRGSYIGRNAEWSLVQGFYINMGGVVIDPRTWPTQFLPDQDNTVWYLQESGVETVARLHPELLESITPSEINDKSKSNALAKTLVCIQALWFIVQCITRVAQDLAISLLELNTFGHCLCAMLIYLLWWHKPFDINEPNVLRGEPAQQLLAWMWMNINTMSPPVGVINKSANRKSNTSNEISTAEAVSHQRIDQTWTDGLPGTMSRNEIILFSGQELLDTGICYKPHIPTFPNHLRLSAIDVECWKLASPIFKRRYEQDGHNVMKTSPPRDFSSIRSADSKLLYIILIFVSFVYGGLHALAWNAPFRSGVEQLLWRISAVVIMAYGVAVVSVTLLLDKITSPGHTVTLGKVLDFSFTFMLDAVRGELGRDALMGPLLVLLNLAYVFGRAYLVLESFLSLFHSVPGVFEQPKWCSYFPHLG